MQNAIKANEADSMFRLYSCSFGIACRKWHHDAAGCQKDSHLRVPNTQMAHIVAREELIDRSFYPLETSRNQMEGSGHFGEPSPGKWQIESEVGSHHLVRTAQFSTTGAPFITITNWGLVKCPGLKMAEFGVLTFIPVLSAEFKIRALTYRSR